MKDLIIKFPAQMQEAINIGQNYRFVLTKKDFNNIIVTGLGGSGIGGSIVMNYVFDKLDVPFGVNKDYFLPAYVNENSLVVVCSYSGNTEETIMAMEAALAKKASVVCITSGGKIAQLAQEHNLDCILVPGGMPPRSCLGYSMTQILYVLHHIGKISGEFVTELGAATAQLIEKTDAMQVHAMDIARQLSGKTPIIYAAPAYEGVAIRFRQQINENSKMLCWHAVVPEMNHNELVGWRDAANDKAVVFLRNADDYVRTMGRMELNRQVITKYTDTILDITSEGNSYWERALYLIHLTDWVSVFLADLKGADATEVAVIDSLKGALAKM
jgi:glucose/mannose-6-phosphate isomerase